MDLLYLGKNVEMRRRFLSNLLSKFHYYILNAITELASEYFTPKLKLPDKFLANFDLFRVKSIRSQSQLNKVNNIISQMIKNDSQIQKKE